MGVQILTQDLEKMGMTKVEFRIEIAVHFYNIGKMSMGQARKFAGLDQISFQKEMATRGVYMKYSMEDFEDDLLTIKELENLKKT